MEEKTEEEESSVTRPRRVSISPIFRRLLAGSFIALLWYRFLQRRIIRWKNLMKFFFITSSYVGLRFYLWVRLRRRTLINPRGLKNIRRIFRKEEHFEPRVQSPDEAAALDQKEVEAHLLQRHSFASESPIVEDQDIETDLVGADIHKQRELRMLQKLPHFLCMSRDEVEAISQRMKRVEIEAGEVLFDVGEPTDSGMFVLLEGVIDIYTLRDQGPSVQDQDDREPTGCFKTAITTAMQEASTGDGTRQTKPKSKKNGKRRRSTAKSVDVASAPQDPIPPSLRRTVSDSDSAAFREYAEEEVRLTFLSSFQSGQSFGENDLLAGENTKRMIRAKAKSKSSLLQLDRQAFRQCLEAFPSAIISFILNTTVRQWKVASYVLYDVFRLQEIAELTPTFKTEVVIPVDSPEGQFLIEQGHLELLGPTQPAYQEGEQADCFFYVVKGKLRTFAEKGDGQLVQLEEAGPGALMGWRDSFCGSVRSELCQAVGITQVVALPIKVFADIHGGSSFPPPLRQLHRRRRSTDSSNSVDSTSSGIGFYVFEDQQEEETVGKESPESELDASGAAVWRRVLTKVPIYVGKMLAPYVRIFLGLGMKRMWLRAGDILYKHGDEATELFVIISGRLRTIPLALGTAESGLFYLAGNGWKQTLYEGRRGSEYGRGEIVGDISLLTGGTRDSTVYAVRDTLLVTVSKASFHHICKIYPNIMERFLVQLARQVEVQKGGRTVFTPTMPLPPPWAAVATSYPEGEAVKSEAIPDGAAFRLLRKRASSRQTLEASLRVESGDSLPSPRTISRNLCNVTLIPAGSKLVHMKQFAEGLLPALGLSGPTFYLDSETVERALGESASHSTPSLFSKQRIISWLTDLEEKYRFVVYQADSFLSEWTKYCIRMADCILLVGDGGADPVLSPIESYLFSPSYHSRRSYALKELVLLHYGMPELPSHTREWFVERKIRQHHHLRLTIDHVKMDLERLARHLSGHSVGLVLGGGGARGLAHFGVLQALESHSVPVDVIGGTSQGSMIAALYAMTLCTTTLHPLLEHFCRNMGDPINSLADITFPILSYFSGQGMDLLLKEVFGDVQVEDLWIPFFCVTTNVTHSKEQIHQTGPLWKYVRASMSVAGLVPPVRVEGDTLVDGGYVNNLPVDVLVSSDLAPGIVIAVDVENKQNIFLGLPMYDSHVSGGWLLWQALLGYLGLGEDDSSMPFLPDVLLGLTFLTNNQKLRELIEEAKMSYNLIYIQPHVQEYKLLDWSHFPELTEKGREEGTKVIARWKEAMVRMISQHIKEQEERTFRRVASLYQFASGQDQNKGQTGSNLGDPKDAVSLQASSELSDVERTHSSNSLSTTNPRGNGAEDPPTPAPFTPFGVNRSWLRRRSSDSLLF